MQHGALIHRGRRRYIEAAASCGIERTVFRAHAVTLPIPWISFSNKSSTG